MHRKYTGTTWLTLFATTGTLVCCALPIILVSLGLGATVAALTSSFPMLIILSQHKIWVFGISAALLGLSGWLMFRPNRTCPTDPELATLCTRTQVWNRRIFWGSVSIWSIGFFSAYLLLPISLWLGLL